MNKGVQISDGRQQKSRIILKEDIEGIPIQCRTLTNLEIRSDLPENTVFQSGFKLARKSGFMADKAKPTHQINFEPLATFLGMPAIPGFKECKLLATKQPTHRNP